VNDLLACPRCGGALSEAGGEYACVEHGRVGTTTLGIADFFPEGGTLAAAAGGEFDLDKDARAAAELERESQGRSFAELVALKSERDARDEAAAAPACCRAQERFARLYAAGDAEVGLASGVGIVTKVNAALEDQGHPPLGGDAALEGGSGHGLHLPGFAPHFKRVVLVDCSLVHLLMARRLAEEQGIEGAIFVRADLTALPFRDGAFDFVHENGVIEHVEDPQAMVKEGLRATSGRGTFMVLNPGRFPVTPEPHFRLVLFGAFPRALRARLIPHLRGVTSEAGTDLRSLSSLRGYFAQAGASPLLFFVPRRLRATVRQTGIRRAVRAALQNPAGAALLDLVLNRLLLGVMPYQIALVTNPRGAGTPRG
jgi:ubiquinone/menaquinone biosynthesis C-methylase UbiE